MESKDFICYSQFDPSKCSLCQVHFWMPWEKIGARWLSWWDPLHLKSLLFNDGQINSSCKAITWLWGRVSQGGACRCRKFVPLHLIRHVWGVRNVSSYMANMVCTDPIKHLWEYSHHHLEDFPSFSDWSLLSALEFPKIQSSVHCCSRILRICREYKLCKCTYLGRQCSSLFYFGTMLVRPISNF